MMLRMKHVAVWCALLLIGALTGPVMAQGYPAKTAGLPRSSATNGDSR